jgi:hypothetical protein
MPERVSPIGTPWQASSAINRVFCVAQLGLTWHLVCLLTGAMLESNITSCKKSLGGKLAILKFIPAIYSPGRRPAN